MAKELKPAKNPTFRKILILLLALFNLAIIGWAGLWVFERPCRALNAYGCSPLLWDLEPLIVALVFWFAGLVVGAGGRNGAAAMFLLCSAALAAGKLSGMGSDMGGRLFYILLAWLAPVTFYFYHTLLDRPPHRLGRAILFIFSSLAIVGSLPLLVWPVIALEATGEFFELRLGIRLLIIAAFGLGWLLLFRDYRGVSRLSQQHIRLTVFGTLLAAAPLLLLSLLPDTLSAPAHLRYEWTFPWLIFAPLSYVYSLFRGQWPRVEVAINRITTYYMATIFFLGFYLAAVGLLNYFAARFPSDWPLGTALLSVVLVLLFTPLQRFFRHAMIWILYGAEIHYTEVVAQISEALALALDREVLCQLLLVDLPRTMRLTWVRGWLTNDEQSLAALCVGDEPTANLSTVHLLSDSPLRICLQNYSSPISDHQLRQLLSGKTPSTDEAHLLGFPGTAYWLPLVSRNELQGLLLIGCRARDDPFSTEDERILVTLSHQAGIAAHNIRLTEEMRLAQQELARTHRQLLLEQDQSRRRLALELHDEGIQQLVGMLFQINQMERDISRASLHGLKQSVAEHLSSTLESLRDETSSLVIYLRSLTYELHPPGLEEMGLTPTLEGYVHHIAERDNRPLPLFELHLDHLGRNDVSLPVATSIFRAAQEALNNAVQHSRAQHVSISLQLCSGQVILNVSDDGCGFCVPTRLSEFARGDHFGLMGIAERAGWVGGQLDIHSKPGGGTKVTVRIPLGFGKEGLGDVEEGKS